MTAISDIQSPNNREEPRRRYAIDCAGARLQVHARSLATVLRFDGEIDASNAALVARAIRRLSRLNSPLVLDLSHLDFIAMAGFRVFLTLNEEHQDAGLQCSMIGGAALGLLTGVIPDHGLPLAESVPEAVQLIEDAIRARREFLGGLARQQEPQRRQAGTD
jgi:anti-anti-sigma factor